jgi:hypothetical protein
MKNGTIIEEIVIIVISIIVINQILSILLSSI